MSTQIQFTPQDLDPKQIEAIAKSLTDEQCEFGERFTPEQLRRALWQVIEDKVGTMLDDLESAMGEHHRFEEILGEPEHYDDPRAARCLNCGHARGNHDEAEHTCAGDIIGRTCSCTEFRALKTKLVFTNFDPRVHDGLGEIQWIADKSCEHCGGTEFYIQTNWYDGCRREQPICIKCSFPLIGLPRDHQVAMMVEASREHQEEGPNTL